MAGRLFVNEDQHLDYLGVPLANAAGAAVPLPAEREERSLAHSAA
jgi:hypothetical protein